ncbi:basic leucine zipper transcriptional factor ATF-like, partial [Erinaceus europaeus]|uniref:Basic leucine zipper transcriptional factor ATF-like n=1 Tax=Erinaceus europaeus TaxID=9365 RepID=A0ABM3WJY5_ERIEU
PRRHHPSPTPDHPPLPPQESEDLEKQNAALRKEIQQLTEEMKYFTSLLSNHEPLCSALGPATDLYSAHAFHQPHGSPRFQP